MTRVFLSFPRSEHMISEMSYVLTYELSGRGIEVMKADDLLAGSNWQASILSSIKKADVLIAVVDFPKSNSNVMLEIGYAIGAGRPVMLLCENPSQIPFDLSSIPAIAIRNFGPWAIQEVIDWIEKFAPKRTPDRPTFDSARDHLRQAVYDSECLEQISPIDFEQLIGQFLSEIGLHASVLRGRNDTGFDIEIYFPDGAAAVLVKKFTSQGRLGIGDVQRLLGACVVAGMDSGVMITNTGYTTSALEFAAQSPISIHLMTLEELLTESKESLTKRCARGYREGRFEK